MGLAPPPGLRGSHSIRVRPTTHPTKFQLLSSNNFRDIFDRTENRWNYFKVISKYNISKKLRKQFKSLDRCASKNNTISSVSEDLNAINNYLVYR